MTQTFALSRNGMVSGHRQGLPESDAAGGERLTPLNGRERADDRGDTGPGSSHCDQEL
jgi:hypothetical protein